MKSTEELREKWRKQNKAFDLKNPGKRVEYVKKAQAKKRQWFLDYKKTLSCQRCGFDDYRALQFHHLRDKYRNIAHMVKSHGPKAIMAEIEKCEVLCANCHAIEHSPD